MPTTVSTASAAPAPGKRLPNVPLSFSLAAQFVLMQSALFCCIGHGRLRSEQLLKHLPGIVLSCSPSLRLQSLCASTACPVLLGPEKTGCELRTACPCASTHYSELLTRSCASSSMHNASATIASAVAVSIISSAATAACVPTSALLSHRSPFPSRCAGGVPVLGFHRSGGD